MSLEKRSTIRLPPQVRDVGPAVVFAKRVGVTVDDERCATDLKRRIEGGELFKHTYK